MSWLSRSALAAFLLFSTLPAHAVDIQNSNTPGNQPSSLTDGELAINRADKKLFFKNSDGTIGNGALMNTLASGRKAMETGDASDLILGSGGPTIATVFAGKANLASPAFTGTPTAPTAAAGTNTTQVATTAFVATLGGTKADLASPTFTGTPTAPTAAAGTNTTQLATTAFATTIGNAKANLASPAFTGTPTAPTAAAGTNTTQLATTAFATALGNLKANIASPTLNNTVTITSTGNAQIEHGRQDGTASSPLIDFHSGATAVDYDYRILASGGTGSVGGGVLSLQGRALNLSGTTIAPVSVGAISAGTRDSVFEVRGGTASTDAAYVAFHRPGQYAAYFGIDTDNEFKFGGFSESTNTYRFWTSKNFTPAGKLDTTGDGSAVKVKNPATNAVTYSLADRAADQISVMDFIPEDQRASIRARTNTTDLTANFRQALATGRNVYVPAGNYKICDKLTISTGQRMIGDGETTSRLMIGSCYNLQASSVIEFGNGDSAGMDGFEIVFDQSAAAAKTVPASTDSGYAAAVQAVRDAIVRYPWAMDLSKITRPKFGNIRISSAWNGIYGIGNPGGLDWNLLEVGALNTAVILDGLLDFAHFTSIHCWPFDMAGSNSLMAVYASGTPECMNVGKVDGLDIKSLGTFQTKITFTNKTSVVANNIGVLQLDADWATLSIAAGNLQIGSLNSTKSEGTKRPTVYAEGGAILTIGNIRMYGTHQFPAFQNAGDGTITTIGGGHAQQLTDWTFGQSDGGVLSINNVYFELNPFMVRNNAVLLGGGGALVAKNNVVKPRGNGSGVLIQVNADNASHSISGNNFNGYTYSVPFRSKLGQYGPNRVAPFTFTPTFAFSTPGNSTVTYSQQLGEYTYEENGVRANFALLFSLNAYTSASGQASITGMPLTSSRDPWALPATFGAIANVTFPSGVTGLTGFSADNRILFRMVGSGYSEALASTGEFPASRSNIRLTGSVFIPY